MNDSKPADDADAGIRQAVRPLLRTRQIREFTAEPLTSAELDALVDVARWSGSSGNEQRWHLIVIRDVATLRQIAEIGMPQTRSLHTATAAIAVVHPADPGRAISDAYDEGRLVERILVAATTLDLGAGITWITGRVRPAILELIGIPEGRSVRTIVALGHPTDAARRPKSAPGQARKPRSEVVIEEHWPAG